MRLRSPKDNEKGYEITQHMVSRESDSRPRFGGELEWGPSRSNSVALIPTFPRGGGRSSDPSVPEHVIFEGGS
jgi:hypothetical protein